MLSKKLKEIAIAKKMSSTEFIDYLTEKSDLPYETVKNVYYGKTQDPKTSTTSAIADALNMNINCLLGHCSHTKEERLLMGYYRDCGPHGRAIIETVAKFEAVSAKASRESIGKHRIPCLIPHGNIYQGIIYDTCETIEIETSVKEAHVAIQMTTNDLVPIFCKGDIILLDNRLPDAGEYGAFYKNGRAYIRKFIEEPGQYRLQCIHKLGEDMVFKRLDSIDYLGTCIDVIRV